MDKVPSRSIFAKQALLTIGWAENVRINWDEQGRIDHIEMGVSPSSSCQHVEALLPGMANLHCHAFQRAIAGLAEISHSPSDSFWSWRELMYQFVEHLTPSDAGAIAAFVYMEMLEAGFTAVGEFHYLHHQADGTAYDQPAEMANRVMAGADLAGLDMTLLPVFYAHSGFGGAAPGAAQARFLHDVDGYQALVDGLRNSHPDRVIGIAPHSLRAATPDELQALLSANPASPVHIHVAEQMAEVEACQAELGARPVRYLLDEIGMDDRWCLVHATHMDSAETRELAASGAVAGLCPITEANLGDGLFDGVAFQQAGGTFGIGSDSCVRIDLAEELRLLEYGQRLQDQGRARMAPIGTSVGGHLYRQAAAGGAQALHQPTGSIAKGQKASFVSLDISHPSLVGRTGDALLDGWIFAAGRSPVQHVWVSGQQRVRQQKHQKQDMITNAYKKALLDILSRFNG
jgi:formiminoglutamate deiminase